MVVIRSGVSSHRRLSGAVLALLFAVVVIKLTTATVLVQGTLPSGAVAEWKFDETSGTTAADTSGGGNNATLTGANGLPTWVTGKIAGALNFDGVDDQVSVASPTTALKPTSYAISAWVNFTGTDTSGGEVASMGDSYALRVQPSGAVKTYFYAGGTLWPSTITTATIKDGLWHHIVGQYDRSTSALQIYIDGTLQASQATAGESIIYTLGSAFSIGRHGNGGGNHDYHGSIDQVRVYPRALTTTEIIALRDEAVPLGAQTVKIMEWNVRKCRGTDTASGGSDCPRVASAVNAIGPDIVLLSAVKTLTDAQTIQSTLQGLAAPGVTWSLHYASVTGEGQAILTTGTMPESGKSSHAVTQAECGGAEGQTLVKATVTVKGKTLSVFAVDQQNGSSEWAVRKCQAKVFWQWAETFAEPRIVGGDFNSPPGDPGISEWLDPVGGVGYKDGWEDSPSKTGYDHGPSATTGNVSTDLDRFGRTLTRRIDYIIYSKGATTVTPISAQVYDVHDVNTTCHDLNTTDGFIGGSGNCNADCFCQYVDNTGVRPTDHIPVLVTFSIQ